MEEFWHNGQLKTGASITLSLTNPGWLYGATVFTTLRVYAESLDHPLTAWSAHCDRLEFSLQAFGWRSPDWNTVRQGSQRLAEQYPVLRITLFPDGSELITGRSLPSELTQNQQQGITAWIAGSEYQRSLAAHKTGNYLSCWLALQEAQRRGAQEAILTDSAGHWLETSTGNLWGWADGSWWTPPLSHSSCEHSNAPGKIDILPGIVRSQVISWLKWQNERTNESHWFGDRATQFETLAYTNSVRQVIPIHTVVDGTTSEDPVCHRFNVNHPALQHLKARFENPDICPGI